MEYTIRFALDLQEEYARIRFLHDAEGHTAAASALGLHLAMLRAFEADNTGRMHQIKALMNPFMVDKLHTAIKTVLSIPEEVDGAETNIYEGEESWAVYHKEKQGYMRKLFGPMELYNLQNVELAGYAKADGSEELLIVHLPTGIAEYHWGKIEDPSAPVWFRWLELPLTVTATPSVPLSI